VSRSDSPLGPQETGQQLWSTVSSSNRTHIKNFSKRSRAPELEPPRYSEPLRSQITICSQISGIFARLAELLRKMLPPTFSRFFLLSDPEPCLFQVEQRSVPIALPVVGNGRYLNVDQLSKLNLSTPFMSSKSYILNRIWLHSSQTLSIAKIADRDGCTQMLAQNHRRLHFSSTELHSFSPAISKCTRIDVNVISKYTSK